MFSGYFSKINNRGPSKEIQQKVLDLRCPALDHLEFGTVLVIFAYVRSCTHDVPKIFPPVFRPCSPLSVSNSPKFSFFFDHLPSLVNLIEFLTPC